MKTRPKILNNIGLKLFAFAFAFILWLLVTNYNDPVIETRIYDVPVQLLHTDLILDSSRLYSVVDNSDVISMVSISGSRSVLDLIRTEDVTATADVANMTEDGLVPITVSVNKFSASVDSVRSSSSYVELLIEDSDTRVLPLETDPVGTVGEDYVLGSIRLEQNQVRVTGPASQVSSVARAVASVVVSGATENITTYSDIVLYDADGNQVTGTNMTMNIYSVRLTVEVLPVKEAEIRFTTQGVPGTGFMLTGQNTAEPATVRIAGTASALKNASGIEIPASELNVSGLRQSLVKTVNLSTYLPEGTSFADERFDGRVTIRIGIGPAPEEPEEEDADAE